MQNKNKLFGVLFVLFAFLVVPNAWAVDDEILTDEFVEGVDSGDVDDVSAMAVGAYNVDGTVFQQITDLEQEKVLMELEKERAQLDLDLDRLAAEKIKLQMEMDTLSGRAEQEQQILQNEKARLEAEAAKIEQEKRAIAAATEAAESGDTSDVAAAAPKKKPVAQKKQREEYDEDIASMYKLVNVMGAGNQLQATLSDLETGQTKRVSVGKKINGFTVKSISLEDGVVFSKDGETQNLNISSR